MHMVRPRIGDAVAKSKLRWFVHARHKTVCHLRGPRYGQKRRIVAAAHGNETRNPGHLDRSWGSRHARWLRFCVSQMWAHQGRGGALLDDCTNEVAFGLHGCRRL